MGESETQSGWVARTGRNMFLPRCYPYPYPTVALGLWGKGGVKFGVLLRWDGDIYDSVPFHFRHHLYHKTVAQCSDELYLLDTMKLVSSPWKTLIPSHLPQFTLSFGGTPTARYTCSGLYSRVPSSRFFSSVSEISVMRCNVKLGQVWLSSSFLFRGFGTSSGTGSLPRVLVFSRRNFNQPAYYY